ncbi:MAG: hypothetical protein INR68_09345 [Methylobacterium mesophilicum]|nr:hypothetical protein [Methylobacterium mesophilicum]
MQATGPGAVIRAMIGGEADMDLELMRRSVAHFCGNAEGGHPLHSPCEELVQAIELLDLAIMHGLPASMVQRLRLDAQRRLDRVESVETN